LATDLAAPMITIAGVADVINFLQSQDDMQTVLQSMRGYQQAYCKLA